METKNFYAENTYSMVEELIMNMAAGEELIPDMLDEGVFLTC